MSWYLMYLRLPLCHVFTIKLTFDWYVLQCQYREMKSKGMSCFTRMQYLTYTHSFLMESFFCVHWSSYLYLSFHVILFSVCSLIWCIWFFLRHSRDRLYETFIPRIFNRHFYFCDRLFQKLSDLQFGWLGVEYCYNSLSLMLVSMCSPGFVTSVFIFFVYVKDFLFHIHVSFTDLLVSVVLFFHFDIDWVHLLELCSDWIRDCLQKFVYLLVDFSWVVFHLLLWFSDYVDYFFQEYWFFARSRRFVFTRILQFSHVFSFFFCFRWIFHFVFIRFSQQSQG